MIESIYNYQDLITASAKRRIPLRCSIELTCGCNLNCVHCYIVKQKKQKELNSKKVFNILDQLKAAGCLYLTFTGGEILTRNDFFDIALYARRLNFAIALFTNGVLINEKIADKIKDIKPISIEISLYGFKSAHEKITRVKGSFDKTIRAIELLKKRGIKVSTKTPLMRFNTDEIWKLQKFVKDKLGISWRGIGGGLLLFPCEDGDVRPLDYRLKDMQIRKYMKEELSKLKSLGNDYAPRKIGVNEPICGMGSIGCHITSYGEVNPCVQIRFKKKNSLKTSSFIEIWKHNEKLNMFRNLRMSSRKDCIGCKFISYCSYCPALPFLEQGSFLLTKAPELCRQARIRKHVYDELYKGKN